MGGRVWFFIVTRLVVPGIRLKGNAKAPAAGPLRCAWSADFIIVFRGLATVRPGSEPKVQYLTKIYRDLALVCTFKGASFLEVNPLHSTRNRRVQFIRDRPGCSSLFPRIYVRPQELGPSADLGGGGARDRSEIHRDSS